MSKRASRSLPPLTEIAFARPSSTVVLARPAVAEPELFMVRRHAKSSFGAAHAFPGGVVDPEDNAVHEFCTGIAAKTATWNPLEQPEARYSEVLDKFIDEKDVAQRRQVYALVALAGVAFVLVAVGLLRGAIAVGERYAIAFPNSDGILHKQRLPAMRAQLEGALKYAAMAVEHLEGQPFFIPPAIKAAHASYAAEAERQATIRIGPLTYTGLFDSAGNVVNADMSVGPMTIRIERVWSQGSLLE